MYENQNLTLWGEDLYRVEIILKEGVIIGGPEIKTYRTIGYAESVEFYSPIYDTPEKIADENPISGRRCTGTLICKSARTAPPKSNFTQTIIKTSNTISLSKE